MSCKASGVLKTSVPFPGSSYLSNREYSPPSFSRTICRSKGYCCQHKGSGSLNPAQEDSNKTVQNRNRKKRIDLTFMAHPRKHSVLYICATLRKMPGARPTFLPRLLKTRFFTAPFHSHGKAIKAAIVPRSPPEAR